MQSIQEVPIRGLENYTKWPILPSTLDFTYADVVRGYKYHPVGEHTVHVDPWEGAAGPDKLMSSSQLSGRWTGSIGACLAELDSMAYKIPGFVVTLVQDSARPHHLGYRCTVSSDAGTLAEREDATFPLAILKCAIEVAIHHKHQ